MKNPSAGEEIFAGEILTSLLGALAPVAPPAAAAIKSRILERIAAADEGVTVVRAAQGEWTAFAPGVDMKVLFDDGRTRTWLARLEREARLPGHDHPADEECLMLEGSVYMGDILMAQGDYQVARKGSRHTGVHSPDGCLILVRSASPAAVL